MKKISPYDAQNTHIAAAFNYGTGNIDIYIYSHKDGDDVRHQMHGSETIELKPGEAAPGPSFSINHKEAIHLMDMLWRAGIKPSEIGTVGHLEATKYHLEDMRKLVSARYKVDL